MRPGKIVSIQKIVSILVPIIMAVVALSASVVLAGEYQAHQVAGDLEVFLTIDKNPPVVGNNSVTIAIKDRAGKQVTDAAVRLEYSMAAMPGMPAVNYKLDASLSGDGYTVSISPSMAGPWLITIKVLRANKIETARFNIDVQ